MKTKGISNIIGILFLLALANIFFTHCKKDTTRDLQPQVDNKAEAGTFVSGKTIKVPLIAWGADLVTINANGISPKTIKGSLFDQAGLNIELFREDDFSKQVDMYIKGDIPFIRGTIGMINMASERLNTNKQTQPVVIFQHSWSAGGDALVVKKGTRSISQLKGKTVAIQSYGPHVDYFLKLLRDSHLTPKDVKIKWTKDLVGPRGDTPMAQLYNAGIDAAFVIIPDALALTSNGTTGTGAEDSIKGARILLSTKTANRIISDVYAVRKDFYDSNTATVKQFVHTLLRSEEQVKDMFKAKDGDNYKKLLSVGGKLLLDDSGAATDIEGMYYDAEMAGFNGNVKFLADKNYPRNCERLTTEIQNSLKKLGTIQKSSRILTADWDFNELKSGLKYANITAPSRFNTQKTKVIAEKLSKQDNSSLFTFEIYFKPNQNSFSIASYESEFNRVIDFASTYGGAIITIEGHSDPMSFLRKKKAGADPIMLKKIKQSAKNLSFSRASSVKDAIMNHANSKGITLDTNQFTIIGHGLETPRYAVPKNEKEWLSNMRVQFKIIQIEAEEDAFKPL